jgi:hypothetical protein
MENRFFLKYGAEDWHEVTREEWIRAERAAGFQPKIASTDPRYWTTEATGGFSSGNVSGRVEYAR